MVIIEMAGQGGGEKEMRRGTSRIWEKMCSVSFQQNGYSQTIIIMPLQVVWSCQPFIILYCHEL